MQNDYKHYGKTLTASIAKDLIKDNFEGEIEYQELRRQVDELHLTSGGQPYAGKTHHPVRTALTKLNKEGVVSNVGLGKWLIGSRSSSSAFENDEGKSDYPPTIGTGRDQVYVYYFPTFKRMAESEDKSIYECKIGRTEDDAKRRSYSQTGTGLPEEREIGLVIRTDAPKKVERYLHGILKIFGRRKEEAPGTEWFYTNPVEVEDIFKVLDSFNRAV